ncbi:hypothetical protein HN604_03275 [archaeon]|nr:hypothetical protein [archaeon]MBT6182262.1 hypothetical protein [archaeon]MBT6606199.1 hypothetical protein [archaeon]MBT7251632.1 hypothetical protein [archaeon]MBT7661078.1 hypothetical protein [archaeon]
MERESNFARRGRTKTRCTPFANAQGQVTIFIIVAIVIVLGIILYFSLDFSSKSTVPEELVPVYDYFLSCLEETARNGVDLLGTQGGYIETPAFVAGSSFMPFSSQLDFFGQGIPYWMYVSGNNLIQEQVPTIHSMETELEKYVGNRIVDCNFDDFELAGYDVYVENGDVEVTINPLEASLEVSSPLTIYRGDVSVVVTKHSVGIDTKLGKFYDLALDVYSYQQDSLFLEQYALDVMRLYAPVTGTELSCTPKIFKEEEIKADIVEGLSQNIPTIKLGDDYYDLSSQERSYFVAGKNLDINENVNFMYSNNWPTKIEILGDTVVTPVGLQEGLGILGFCYIPYHLVYDISFPVMVQFFDDDELFQFPIAVVISQNQPRTAFASSVGVSIESEVCQYKNQNLEVYTFDNELNPVPSTISFKCLSSLCGIGETKTVGNEAVLSAEFPACVNGFVVAQAEGYAEAKYQISSTTESVANIVLNKKYSIDLDLGSVPQAIITFTSEDFGATALYPETKTIELIEGNYNISVQVYDDTSLVFPAINEQKCVDVPADGLSGFFGVETEECYDIEIPETKVDFAIVGGGKTNEYITETMLRDSNEINVNVPLFGLPGSLDEIQENYLKAEDEFIYLSFE